MGFRRPAATRVSPSTTPPSGLPRSTTAATRHDLSGMAFLFPRRRVLYRLAAWVYAQEANSPSMNELLFSLYQRSPYALKVCAASLRGLHLRHWRYGSETDALVSRAVAREHWSPDQWARWQAERLSLILKLAKERIPHYVRVVHAAGAHDLRAWPVLPKSEVRRNPVGFLDPRCNRRLLWKETTSGTTGTPLTLWQSRATLRQWYALFEARWRGWNGLSRHDRWGILGGQLITPAGNTKPPFWVWNAAMKQLYLSSYHLRPEHGSAYVESLRDHGVTYLWGYASALSALARIVIDHRLSPPPLRAIISNAEPLYGHQRQTIRDAFRCRVVDTYGMSEMVCAASECEAGRMHLWPEVGIPEILRDDRDEPAPPGEPGRLVCTGLISTEMPLIRYDTGDRVALEPEHAKCECGRTLPLLRQVEGRCDDTILTPDGRRVGRLDPVFKAALPIVEAQIEQRSPTQVHVRIVPANGYSQQTELEVARALRERLGDMDLSFERCSRIPRGPNGKFKAVVCKIRTADTQPAPPPEAGF